MLPVCGPPQGSTTIVYVPVVGRVVTSMNPPVSMQFEVSVLPSGFLTMMFRSHPNDGLKLADALLPTTEIRCVAVPANVNVAFCPGVVVVIGTDDPPGVIVPVMSAGTSTTVSVMLPVAAPSGWRSTVYVPVAPSCTVSMKPPVSMHVGAASVLVSGFAMLTLRSQPNV